MVPVNSIRDLLVLLKSQILQLKNEKRKEWNADTLDTQSMLPNTKIYGSVPWPIFQTIKLYLLVWHQMKIEKRWPWCDRNVAEVVDLGKCSRGFFYFILFFLMWIFMLLWKSTHTCCWNLAPVAVTSF